MNDSFSRRSLLGGLAATGLLSACGYVGKPSATEGVQVRPAGSPLIDREIPGHLETATFALG